MRDAAIRLRTTLVSLYLSFWKFRYTIGREYLLGCMISIETDNLGVGNCRSAASGRRRLRGPNRRGGKVVRPWLFFQRQMVCGRI